MRGKCPHCLHDVYFAQAGVRAPPSSGTFPYHQFASDTVHESVMVEFLTCPNCSRLVVYRDVTVADKTDRRLVWPPTSTRIVPPEVSEHIRRDYNESADVLPTSPKASAALSRRCLQTVLAEAGGAKSRDLSDQIDEVLPKLPSHLAESVDAIRAVGNFAAHPIKSKSSGEIVDIEPGEAEWNLEVLDGLFDFYYVQPEKTKQRRTALDQKLRKAGKPPLK